MHMSFEKISDPEPTGEHPALRAAKMIRDLHKETITKMDDGLVFLKDGVDCSDEVRAQCTVQIALCEQIMKRAANMAPSTVPAAQSILDEFNRIAEEAKKNEDGLATIPEIGNYEHGK